MDEHKTMLCIVLLMSLIKTTSTTVTVTAYDGTGIVQQQPLTLVCNYTKDVSDVITDFIWRHGTVIILSGSVTAQTASFQSDTEWTSSGVFLGDFNSTLTIQLPASSLTPSVAGQYLCRVTTLTGGVQDTATATVNYAPQINSTFPSTRTVTEFSRLQIDCSSHTTPGNPTTTSYTWTYGGSTVSSEGVLDINNIGRDSSGQYTCTASNTFTPTGGSQQQGIARARVNVDVQYGPGNSVQVTPEGSTARVEGSGPFTATCTAVCNPACSISWKSDTGDLDSVSISNVSRTDQGSYTCRAQNGIGDPQEKTINLVVYYLDRPALTLNQTEVMENETVHLTCDVESNPTAQQEIRNVDNDTVLVERDTNRLQFTIDRVQCLHNGSIICTARNTQTGEYSSTKYLNVLCSPRTDFRQEQKNVVAKNINETAALVANVIANPVPEFRWFRQESESLTNISKDTVHSISNSRLESVLYINISRTQDYGDYVLEVKNSQGKYQLLFTLTSKVPPSTPIDLKVHGTSHDTVSLSWTSNFNGGSPQNFTLQYRDSESSGWKLGKEGIPDPGRYLPITENVTGLAANTLYEFAVFGSNEFGEGGKALINMTTETLPEQLVGVGLDIVPIASGIVAALVVIAIVAVVCILYRRGTFTSKEKQQQDRILNQSDRVEMEDNVLYASSGPVAREEAVMQENDLYCGAGDINRGASTSQVNEGDIYAKPNKKTKSNDKTVVNEADIYATPNKKTKPQGSDNKDEIDGAGKKRKGKGKNTKDNQKNGAKSRQNRGDVYENAEQFGAAAAADGVYANAGFANEGFEEDEKPEEAKENPKCGRDEDGLMYVGIDFGNQKPGNEIIRTDAPTAYATVVFGKVGEPLPDDEDENTKQ